MKLTIEKDTLTIGDDSFISKMIEGCEGKVFVKARGIKREMKQVKDSKGKIIKEKKEK